MVGPFAVYAASIPTTPVRHSVYLPLVMADLGGAAATTPSEQRSLARQALIQPSPGNVPARGQCWLLALAV